MNPNCVRKPEQIKLIMECRQSGLSDYQWCRKQGINPGTFYNWVSKLRKAGYTVPDPAGKVSAAPVMQEVVKLDLAESGISTPAMPAGAKYQPFSFARCSLHCRRNRMQEYQGAHL